MGDEDDAQTILSAERPEYNVLVPFCEETEVEILKVMNPEPRVPLLETNGMSGRSETQMRERLCRRNMKWLQGRWLKSNCRACVRQTGFIFGRPYNEFE